MCMPLFLCSLYIYVVVKKGKGRTGVINDPLGQPTVSVGSDCRLILKFFGRTDGRTICVKIVITTGRDCGRPRGSIHFPAVCTCESPLSYFPLFSANLHLNFFLVISLISKTISWKIGWPLSNLNAILYKYILICTDKLQNYRLLAFIRDKSSKLVLWTQQCLYFHFMKNILYEPS